MYIVFLVGSSGESFWPLHSHALHFTSLASWIESIFYPRQVIGIPSKDFHLFQIFATVARGFTGIRLSQTVADQHREYGSNWEKKKKKKKSWGQN
jgi:hypothetical protein